MESDNKKDVFDVFVINTIFPDSDSLFSAGPSSLQAIKEDCIIVLDTNVLLIPFSTGKESLEQIRNTFKILLEAEQLIVPGQVAREFARNRARRLAEVFQQLTRKMNSIPQLQKGQYPLLETLDVYQTVIALEKEIDSRIRDYKNALRDVLKHVRNWVWNDPVSLMYSDLFTKDAVIFDPEFDQLQVKKDLEIKQRHKIPPGYKDAHKDDKGIGDLLVWLTILEIGKSHKKNVMFVTGDDKADWWYKSEGQSLYPRYELVDEFRRISDGKLFHMIHFSTFLDLYGASEEVVKEVRQQESVEKVDDFITDSTFDTAPSFQDLQTHWHEWVHNDVQDIALSALLRDCDPVSLEEDTIILRFNHRFHCERISKEPYKTKLTEILSQLLDRAIDVLCIT